MDRKALLNFGDHLFTEEPGALRAARGAQAATSAGESHQVHGAADATPHPGQPAVKDAAVKVMLDRSVRPVLTLRMAAGTRR